jgi:hypothetical protein
MATISKGIKLYRNDEVLENLQEIPDLGGTAESIEITTLADAAHMYTEGILNYGDSIAFKFLYEKAQFTELQSSTDADTWKVELPDGAACTFSGKGSVKLDAVGVNAALTYTLNIKPNSAMVWGAGA